MTVKRYAVVNGSNATVDNVARYLPANYSVLGEPSDGIVVGGTDRAGFTLDNYVIPRLGSGLLFAREIDLSHGAIKQVPAEPTNFDEWMVRIDNAVQALSGLSAHDLPDAPYRDWFDDGLSP